MGNTVTEVSEIYKWAESIRSSWGRAISAFFAVGRKLNDAKEVLGHGRFMKMIEQELPFSVATAERLMAIARNQVLATHMQTLPASYSTLYELSRLPDAFLKQKLSDGTISADMDRQSAQILVLEHQRTREAPRRTITAVAYAKPAPQPDKVAPPDLTHRRAARALAASSAKTSRWTNSRRSATSHSSSVSPRRPTED